MKVLFYATKRNKSAERLQKVVEAVVPQDQLVMHRTFGSLSRRLHQPGNDLNIAALTATSEEELAEIFSLRDFLSDIRIILILPDTKRATISKAHTMGPRFLTYVDSDFEEVKAVLSKMLEKFNYNEYI